MGDTNEKSGGPDTKAILSEQVSKLRSAYGVAVQVKDGLMTYALLQEVRILANDLDRLIHRQLQEDANL